MDNGEVKKVLFGEINLTHARGNFPPDLKKLRRPFASKGKAIYWFCSGCGAIYEIVGQTAERLINRATPVDLKVIKKTYFISSPGCLLCDGPREPVKFVALE